MAEWNDLAPHRPLDPGDARYVRRPEGSGEEIAKQVDAGFSPLAIAGPMGCGKSTELAAAEEKLLSRGTFVCRIPMDRLLDVRAADTEAVYRASGQGLLEALKSRRNWKWLEHSAVRSSPTVISAVAGRREWEWLEHLAILVAEERGHGGYGYGGGGGVVEEALALARMEAEARESRRRERRDQLLGLLREIAQAASGRKAALLVDGLEKCPDAIAREIIQPILALHDEANLVIVVPTSLVTGPAAYDFVSTVKVFPIHPVLVDGAPAAEVQRGRQFLFEIALRRLGGPFGQRGDLLHQAEVASGGIPRTFLQLLRDASRYASLAERDAPAIEDLEQAERDHTEHLERLLDAGDLDALRSADGTDGKEIKIERRLRLLVHGLLLEYRIGGRTVVHPAPLLAGALARRDAA